MDSTSGIAALAFMMRLGAMHTVTGLPSTSLDVVPVDVVARRLVNAIDDPHELNVTHAVAGIGRGISIAEVVKVLSSRFAGRVGPVGRVFMRVIAPRCSWKRKCSLLCDILALGLRECVAVCFGHVEKARLIRSLRRRLMHFDSLFEHFTSVRYDFESDLSSHDCHNSIELLGMTIDKKIFLFRSG